MLARGLLPGRFGALGLPTFGFLPGGLGSGAFLACCLLLRRCLAGGFGLRGLLACGLLPGRCGAFNLPAFGVLPGSLGPRARLARRVLLRSCLAGRFGLRGLLACSLLSGCCGAFGLPAFGFLPGSLGPRACLACRFLLRRRLPGGFGLFGLLPGGLGLGAGLACRLLLRGGLPGSFGQFRLLARGLQQGRCGTLDRQAFGFLPGGFRPFGLFGLLVRRLQPCRFGLLGLPAFGFQPGGLGSGACLARRFLLCGGLPGDLGPLDLFGFGLFGLLALGLQPRRFGLQDVLPGRQRAGGLLLQCLRACRVLALGFTPRHVLALGLLPRPGVRGGLRRLPRGILRGGLFASLLRPCRVQRVRGLAFHVQAGRFGLRCQRGFAALRFARSGLGTPRRLLRLLRAPGGRAAGFGTLLRLGARGLGPRCLQARLPCGLLAGLGLGDGVPGLLGRDLHDRGAGRGGGERFACRSGRGLRAGCRNRRGRRVGFGRWAGRCGHCARIRRRRGRRLGSHRSGRLLRGQHHTQHGLLATPLLPGQAQARPAEFRAAEGQAQQQRMHEQRGQHTTTQCRVRAAPGPRQLLLFDGRGLRWDRHVCCFRLRATRPGLWIWPRL